MTTTASHTDDAPLSHQQNQSTPCSKYLHDYIQCIYHDEKCCADLYQKYKKCMTEKIQHTTVKLFETKTTC